MSSPADAAPDVPLLQMRSVCKRFGATVALDDVSLEVGCGEVLALIGENGAGKSTLMKILSGAVSADSGVMRIAGQPFQPRGPHDARRAGVAMIYQELTLCPDLTVEDNVMLGQERHRGGWLDRGSQRRIVQHALDTLGHPDLHPSAPVRVLSPGARQLVEIARALVQNARVIVFDEPTSSLTQRDAQQLFQVIRKLRAAGLGIIYISHFLEEIRQVCDRYSVLRDGRSVGAGPLAGATESQIVTLMVGRDVDELFPSIPHEPGDVVLQVNHLRGARLPADVSFELRRGEILGIAGLVGAGRTETLRALFGLDRTAGGAVLIASKTTRESVRARIGAGLGFLSEDRKGEGLAQSRSLTDNITLSRLEPYSRWGWLNLGRRRRSVDHWLRTMEVKASSAEADAQSLSGGNQQKVALARVLHQDADILLLDEPTRGIDVGTKSEIYRLLGQLAAHGKSIVFVSSYLPELMAVCDRIGVMARGRLREIRATSDWTQESIMACAVRSDE